MGYGRRSGCALHGREDGHRPVGLVVDFDGLDFCFGADLFPAVHRWQVALAVGD